jgi:hypothetical protein
MSRPRVYISGPISSGNRNHNQFQGCEAHKALMLAGFAPLNPIITGNIPFAWDKDVPHSLWLDCDMPWVEVSDAILRLPGYSVGADAECTHAANCGIPIFYSVEELITWKAGLSSDFVGTPEAAKTVQLVASPGEGGSALHSQTAYATY